MGMADAYDLKGRVISGTASAAEIKDYITSLESQLAESAKNLRSSQRLSEQAAAKGAELVAQLAERDQQLAERGMTIEHHETCIRILKRNLAEAREDKNGE